MKTDRKQLKAAAREAMRGAKPHPFWVTLAVTAITAVLMGLSMYLNGTFSLYREVFSQLTSGTVAADALIDSAAEGASGFGSFLVFALEIMINVVSVGYVLYCLRVSRRISASVGDVFDAFGMFFRSVIIRFLRGAVMFLWELVFAVAASVVLSFVLMAVYQDTSAEMLYSLIETPWAVVFVAVLYIPMFVVSYFYRLADCFMLDHPEMGCLQCLTMSRMAMRGRKWELFKLDLSFLGWYILSIVPFVGIWVQPYVTITGAGFYDTVAPAFLQDMEQRMQQRVQRAQDPGAAGGVRDWHIPGGNDRDDGE